MNTNTNTDIKELTKFLKMQINDMELNEIRPEDINRLNVQSDKKQYYNTYKCQIDNLFSELMRHSTNNYTLYDLEITDDNRIIPHKLNLGKLIYPGFYTDFVEFCYENTSDPRLKKKQ